MNRDSLLETLRRFAGQENSIVIPKPFVQFTGGIEPAMMLSQLLYWSERNGGRGRVYKTDKEWADELSLTKYAVRQARAKLESLGILKTEIHRANGNPTVHYYLLEDALSEKWFLWVQKMDFAKSQKRNCEIAKSLTETTTERISSTGTAAQHEKISLSADRAQTAVIPEKTQTEQTTAPIESAESKPAQILEPTPAPAALNVFRVYENEIGLLTPMLADKLKDAEKDYPHAWIIDAIRIAGEQNKRSWAYCEAILKRWKAEGRDTAKPQRAPPRSAAQARPNRESEVERMRRVYPEMFGNGEPNPDPEHQSDVVDGVPYARVG